MVDEVSKHTSLPISSAHEKKLILTETKLVEILIPRMITQSSFKFTSFHEIHLSKFHRRRGRHRTSILSVRPEISKSINLSESSLPHRDNFHCPRCLTPRFSVTYHLQGCLCMVSVPIIVHNGRKWTPLNGNQASLGLLLRIVWLFYIKHIKC